MDYNFTNDKVPLSLSLSLSLSLPLSCETKYSLFTPTKQNTKSLSLSLYS